MQQREQQQEAASAQRRGGMRAHRHPRPQPQLPQQHRRRPQRVGRAVRFWLCSPPQLPRATNPQRQPPLWLSAPVVAPATQTRRVVARASRSSSTATAASAWHVPCFTRRPPACASTPATPRGVRATTAAAAPTPFARLSWTTWASAGTCTTGGPARMMRAATSCMRSTPRSHDRNALRPRRTRAEM